MIEESGAGPFVVINNWVSPSERTMDLERSINALLNECEDLLRERSGTISAKHKKELLEIFQNLNNMAANFRQANWVQETQIPQINQAFKRFGIIHNIYLGSHK